MAWHRLPPAERRQRVDAFVGREVIVFVAGPNRSPHAQQIDGTAVCVAESYSNPAAAEQLILYVPDRSKPRGRRAVAISLATIDSITPYQRRM